MLYSGLRMFYEVYGPGCHADVRSPRPPWRVFSFLHTCWVVPSFMNAGNHQSRNIHLTQVAALRWDVLRDIAA